MEIRLELNQRFGHGFQLHLMNGPMDKLFDHEPLTMAEAGAYAGMLLDAINGELGTDYIPAQVVRVTNDALESSAKTDFTAARILHDAKSRPGADVREVVVDSEKQSVVSARGVILMAWAAWKDDHISKAKDALRRYCEYISAHGYQGGASKAMAALIAMEPDAGARWLKRTFAHHVQDEVAAIRYVLPDV